MLATDLTADLTYAELAAVVDENREPFYSLDQCELYLRAAGMLRRRVPEEADHSGERIRSRDLQVGIEMARKSRGVFLLSAQCPVSIIPPDDLR